MIEDPVALRNSSQLAALVRLHSCFQLGVRDSTICFNLTKLGLTIEQLMLNYPARYQKSSSASGCISNSQYGCLARWWSAELDTIP